MSTCDPWAVQADLPEPCASAAIATGLLDDALQIASDVLYEWTGRRWPGVCSDTIRPCGYRTTTSPKPTGSNAAASGSEWCGCHDSRDCGCGGLSEVRLPGYPVAAVSEVKIDGTVVDAARYRVDDRRWLVYLPESDTAERQNWPCCQRLDRADTEDDTFSIAYTYGEAPPVGGNRAAAALACQLALAFDPDAAGECRLPKRVTTITRQGVSMAVLDPLTLFGDGLTGLPEVDLWVQSVQSGPARRRATAFRPGRRRRVRRTG